MDKEQLKLKLAEIKKTLPQNTPYPAASQMVKNVALSIVNNVQSVLQGNNFKSSTNDASERLSVCKACSFFDKEQERCKKCGCKLAIKTYLKAEKCPIGKW